MKNAYIIFAALVLALCSCGGSNHQTQNETQQPVVPVEAVQTFSFEDIVPSVESVLYAKGDLNNDGFEDIAVVARNEVYRNLEEEMEPVKGEGLRIYFGDSDGRYTLFNTCAVNSRPEDFFADVRSLTIDKEGNLTVEEIYATDGETIQTYVLKYLDNDMYLTDYISVFGVDDDNTVHYDLLNKTAVMDVDWHEMDTDIYHHRTDTYELKDIPLKKLSDFKIGDEVCTFEEYVEDDGLNIFEVSGATKEDLCSSEHNPSYEEGYLNNDGILDLVVNALNSTFAVYYKNNSGSYNMCFQGKSFDRDTETYSYIEEGNLIVNSTTESGKSYTFRDNGYGYYRLIEFEQSMEWPDGGGSYYQLIDFVNGKRTEQVDDKPATTVNIPKRTPVFEEIHFGNMDEIDQLLKE